MTQNQIAYWAMMENKRHNTAQERENYRSNKVKESETRRANIAGEDIKVTSNALSAWGNQILQQRANAESKKADTDWLKYWTDRTYKEDSIANQRLVTANNYKLGEANIQLGYAGLDNSASIAKINQNTAITSAGINASAQRYSTDINAAVQYAKNDTEILKANNSYILGSAQNTENVRSNKVREAETSRHNTSLEKETIRHNYEQESIAGMQGFASVVGSFGSAARGIAPFVR